LLIEILDYFQIVPSSLLHARRGQDGPHGSGCPALLADHFAEIGLMNPQFQNSGLFAVNLSHNDLVRIVNQRFAHNFN
jgi:hypothetical protein